MNRCAWAKNELSIPYHDQEWGVPVHDDRLLFEFRCSKARRPA
jgi:DNA-3-methyladenine glycosylase I